MEGLTDVMGDALLANYSSVLGLQLVNRSAFDVMDIAQPPNNDAMRHAMLLDAMDVLVKKTFHSNLSLLKTCTHKIKHLV